MFLNMHYILIVSYLVNLVNSKDRIQKLCFIPEREFIDACLSPNNACLSKYFSSLGRPCSRIFGQAHSYIGYSNRNFFLIPKIKQEQLLKTWVSHIFFLKPDNWCFGFFETPRHDVIDSCINQSKLCPFTVNTSY